MSVRPSPSVQAKRPPGLELSSGPQHVVDIPLPNMARSPVIQAEDGLLSKLNAELLCMKPNDYSNALVHLYRGELSRQTIYRQRLDQTTNWAITVSATMTTVSLANRDIHPNVHYLAIMFVLVFWLLESRRYVYYTLSKERVRILEMGFYAGVILTGCVQQPLHSRGLLTHNKTASTASLGQDPQSLNRPAPPTRQTSFFAEHLTSGKAWEFKLMNYLNQRVATISLFHSLIIRLRRIYCFILLATLIGWVIKMDLINSISIAQVIPIFTVYVLMMIPLPFIYPETEMDF